MEIRIQHLLGRMVVDVDGNDVGRIEEFRVERDGKTCVLEAYLIGASAVIQRLSAWTLVRPINRLLHGRGFYSSYRVPWQDMDLSDPHHPRLRIPNRELRHAK